MPTRRLSGRWATASILVAAAVATGACGASAPRQFVRTTNESGVWRSIEVREAGDGAQSAEKTRLWSTTVDALTSKYDIEVMDKESGYLRTSWKLTALSSGSKRENYRTRLMAKFNPEWSVLQIKSEAQWLDDGVWINGYDTAVLEDVYGDLQARVGRTRR